MRDALGTSKPTEPSLKRLRSVVSASTQDSSEPDPPRKTRSVAKAVNPMATVVKAVAEAAEGAKNPKAGRSVFDRISHSAGFPETSNQRMVLGEVPPKNEERSEDQEPVQHQYSQRLDNNGVYVDNMTTFDTGLQPSRLGSSVNGSYSSSSLGNRINNPKSLQHRLVDDPNRVKGTNYQNHFTEVATKQKNGGFSGNADTGKTVKLEEQMKVPGVGLQRYTSSEAITESSTVKPAAIAKEDSLIKKPVPGEFFFLKIHGIVTSWVPVG